MNRLQWQGLVFSVIAIVTALASQFFAPADTLTSLIMIASLIFFLGVPHGALDPLFAQKLLSISSWQSWLQFTVVYLILVFLSIMIWWQFPLFFMIGFLLISMLHFSKDLTSFTPVVSRLLYGGAVIVLPALLHFDEIQRLFSLILNDDDGTKIASFLHVLAWPVVIALCCAILYELTKNWRSALEVVAVSLLSIFADPLIGFTLYFCCMHSLRHILRAQRYSQASFGKLLLISLAPMAGTVLIVILGWHYFPPSPDYARIVQVIFVLLAALTLPHMLLIHRVKYV